jgi:hypothetical protein
MATIKKACKGAIYPKSSSVSKRIGSPSKAKKGGSFDLNGDGKTTFKDVLIGRGVLPKTAKKGMKVKKAQYGKMQKDSTMTPKYYDALDKRIIAKDSLGQKKSYTNQRANKVIGKQKMGGKTKKCYYGCK